MGDAIEQQAKLDDRVLTAATKWAHWYKDSSGLVPADMGPEARALYDAVMARDAGETEEG
jgi:hypothetical protein